jgi:hypothetical protein
MGIFTQRNKPLVVYGPTIKSEAIAEAAKRRDTSRISGDTYRGVHRNDAYYVERVSKYG